MSEPVSGPPPWLVRTFVVLAILATLVEVATYSGVFGGGLEPETAVDRVMRDGTP
jgi:hypothetical protein